jgi:hypothetical protein
MESARIIVRPLSLSRLATGELALATLVLASIVVRFATVLERATPRYLPDEYLYAELARSLGRGDGLTVLGAPAQLPSLLQPLLTAPLWRIADAQTAFHATQLLHAAAMSAAALPVYLLAKQLRLSTGWALACAAVSLASPALLYAGYVTADAVGYLLALTAVAVGVRTLARPTAGAQALFLLAVALATTARLQYAVLLPVALLASIVVERGRLARVVRSLPIVTAFAIGLPLTAVAAGSGLLGRYAATTSFSPSREMLGWTASTTFLLALAAGVTLVPGAVAWLSASLARPTSRERGALAALVALLAVGLVFASVVMTVETDSARFLERYLLVLTPLLALSFACWVADGRPLRRIAAVLSLAMVAAVSLVPLSSYWEGQGRADSPLLFALSTLADALGVGNASLVAAGIATACALLALVATTRWRPGPAIATAAALTVLGLVSIGAHAADLSTSRLLRSQTFAREGGWVDAQRPGDVLLVQTPGSEPADTMLTGFWNASVRHAAPLGDSHVARFDGLSDRPVSVRADGTLVERGSPVTGSVLFATGGTTAVLARGGRVVTDRLFTLVVPSGTVRLRALVEGLRRDATLAPAGRIAVYPPGGGGCTTLRLLVALPAGAPPTTLELRQDDGAREIVRLRRGEPTALTLSSTRSRGRSVGYQVSASGSGRVVPGQIARASLTLVERPCGTS